jgi:hypothetical protein
MTEVEVGPLNHQTGIYALDSISGEQFRITTPTAVDPRQTDDAFPVPVTETYRFCTQELRIEAPVSVYIRRPDGKLIGALDWTDEGAYEAGEYLLELTTRIKSYLRLPGPFDILSTKDWVNISFPNESAVVLGVRSKRQHPETTITTTDTPADIATTISHLPTALETPSAERSFPTLRAHPPSIELGSRLSIPADMSLPSTGVQFGVPYELEYLYAAAPLAFYLGATVTEASSPRLIIDSEPDYEFPSDLSTFSTKCHELLARLFTLDCLTRTEGLYPVELHERARLDQELSLDWQTLYDAPLATRTARYLEADSEIVDTIVPRWPAQAFAEPTPRTATILPHLLDQLLPIYPCQPPRYSGSEARSVALKRFMYPGPSPTRSGESVFDDPAWFVDLPEPTANTAVWCGEGVPLRGNKFHPGGVAAYHARTERPGSEITVTLVCNDETMQGELDNVDAIYGARERLPFEIESHRRLSVEALTDLLGSPRDYLHFIGHASEAGLHCRDGVLSPADVTSVGVQSFFFNACSSYRPGEEMVANGSVGGVVTLSDVNEANAEGMGVEVARLLNRGFSLRIALLIAREQSVVGGQYLCVGMDSASVVQPEGGVSYACELNSDETGWSVRIIDYPSGHGNMGSIETFELRGETRHFLAGNSIRETGLSNEAVRAWMSAEEFPVWYDGSWQWSSDLLQELSV